MTLLCLTLVVFMPILALLWGMNIMAKWYARYADRLMYYWILVRAESIRRIL